MKIHTKTIDGRTFQFWFDRTQGGNWWAAEFDADGNQIGGAEFSGTREGIMTQIDYLASITRCEVCHEEIDGAVEYKLAPSRGPKHPPLFAPCHADCWFTREEQRADYLRKKLDRTDLSADERSETLELLLLNERLIEEQRHTCENMTAANQRNAS